MKEKDPHIAIIPNLLRSEQGEGAVANARKNWRGGTPPKKKFAPTIKFFFEKTQRTFATSIINLNIFFRSNIAN
jgi:hypothetical protein